MGYVREATVADHVKPHRFDPVEFWHGELQSLCAPCHDTHKQREEHGATYTSFADVNGYPLDPAHPNGPKP